MNSHAVRRKNHWRIIRIFPLSLSLSHWRSGKLLLLCVRQKASECWSCVCVICLLLPAIQLRQRRLVKNTTADIATDRRKENTKFLAIVVSALLGGDVDRNIVAAHDSRHIRRLCAHIYSWLACGYEFFFIHKIKHSERIAIDFDWIGNSWLHYSFRTQAHNFD